MADVEEIKKRLDIVQIIGEYLTLKKSGVTYKALCPFHSEKTPSFTVSAERQSWHCFGCSEGGDVISFVQKIDGLDFKEALERLAAKAGVDLTPTDPQAVRTKSEKTAIANVLEMAANLYHEILLHHPIAKPARDYLQKRGVSEETVTQFRLGYAPDGWHMVEQMLQKKGLDVALGWQSGLAIRKGTTNQVYDRFRGRLMFPIDATGRIIGFTGRILTDQTDQPKYLNTAESLVFKKSEAVYGLSLARKNIKEQKRAVMVEGQMDVVTAHQFGFTNTVATSGTAVTPDHLHLLKRYTDTVAFAFDNDAAGQKTARTAVELCLNQELNPLIIRIPHGKDPDEAIRHDRELWVQAVADAEGGVDYFINQAFADGATLNALRKKSISNALLPLIRQVKNSVEQAEYVRRLSNRLGVPEASVAADLKRSGSHEKLLQAPPSQATNEPVLDIERQIIGLCFTYFSQLPPLPDLTFDNQALQKIYDQVKQAREQGGTSEAVMNALPKQWQGRLNTLVIETLRRHEQLEESAIALEIIECLHRLSTKDRETRIANHARQIAAAFSKGDRAAARELLKSLDSDTINQE